MTDPTILPLSQFIGTKFSLSETSVEYAMNDDEAKFTLEILDGVDWGEPVCRLGEYAIRTHGAWADGGNVGLFHGDRLIGFYEGPNLWIDPAYRGHGLAVPLILAAANLRGGTVLPPGFESQGYSPAGMMAHATAHLQTLLCAVKNKTPIPEEVLREYNIRDAREFVGMFGEEAIERLNCCKAPEAKPEDPGLSFDFDREIDRGGTASIKHDGRAAYFGTNDVLPMWVADMDFAAPEAVLQALEARARHPFYGYTFYPDGLYQALIAWLEKRHGWRVERDWIVMAPGVVTSLHAAVLAFTAPGEGVAVQPPVYFPFFGAVADTARKLVHNPLRLEQGRYRIDFDHLERCAAGGARLLLLCSPHNPVGRVWTADELRTLLAIARRHGMTVLSDEIHADLVYPGERHTALATLAQAGDSVVTAIAPSKTFNIPGLGLSCLIIPDPAQRAALRRVFATLALGHSNPFSIAAFEAAYRGGEPWLDALLPYLRDNRDLAESYFAEQAAGIETVRSEGTYLLWLDCRALGMDDRELKAFFVHRARVGMNPGTVFGAGGEGFMRLNIATPRRVLREALERIGKALASAGGAG